MRVPGEARGLDEVGPPGRVVGVLQASIRIPGREERIEHGERADGDAGRRQQTEVRGFARFGDERARNCEEQSLRRNEVPVDVEEGVQPADRDDDRRDQSRVEQEADDSRLGEELQRDVVRLHGRLLRVVGGNRGRQRERPGARPAARMARERVPRLPPPGPPVARARARDPAGGRHALRVRELVPAHADEVGRTARAHDEHDHA